MRAGDLRQRITIQKNTPTRDSTNAQVDSWSTVVTLWAEINTLSGSEQIQEAQTAGLLQYRIVVRRYATLAPAMRAIWKGRTFDIQAVLDDNLNKQMTLMCQEVIRG